MVKLQVDKQTHGRLRELAIATAKCWDEVNWLRMRQFKSNERIDFGSTEDEGGKPKTNEPPPRWGGGQNRVE